MIATKHNQDYARAIHAIKCQLRFIFNLRSSIVGIAMILHDITHPSLKLHKT